MSVSTSELDARAVPEIGGEPGGGPPETRGLPLVLRRLLSEGSGVKLLVGKVTAIPDAKHVEVEVSGSRVVIPGLANYVPVIGEGAWCLMGNSITLAIGSASGMRPTTIPAGTSNNQVPVWNATLGAWVPQNQAPNADTLDGIDSAGFLRAAISGRAWWTAIGPVAADGAGRTTTAHPLGVVPTVAIPAMTTSGGARTVLVHQLTAAQVVLQWFDSAGAPVVGVVAGYVLLIG